MRITLPHNWAPRHYQKPFWDYMEAPQPKNAQIGKRAALTWHRRSGKDEACLHHNSCAAFERIGNYWYMLPEYGQCRKAIWDAINPHTGRKRIDEAFPPEIRSNTLSQEMKIVFKNGSTWQLMGSDNYDSLVGAPPIGLTFSEYALSNPTSWGMLRPMLLENGGWAVFNSTPRGKNHHYNLMNLAEDSDAWFSQILTADTTGIFTPEQLAMELKEYQSEHGDEYGKALWLQEYFCSFDAALPGSVWGDSLSTVAEDGRIHSVPHTAGYPVHTAWDLGHDDATAIWFFQVVGKSIKIINTFDCNFKDPDYYADQLFQIAKTNGYRYGTHWLPHDAKPTRMGMGGKSVLQQFMDLRDHYDQTKQFALGKFALVPKLSKEDGIQAARKTFKFCEFDEVNCGDAVEHLKSYRRKYDDEKKVFSAEPVHDEHSHYADAFRYLSLIWKLAREKQVVISQEEKFREGNIVNVSFGDLRKEHLRKKRKSRIIY